MADGPGPLTRRGSSLRLQRRQSGTPYGRKSSSTGLTAYFDGSTKLGFGAEEEDAVPELRASSRTQTIAGKALSAISFSRQRKDKGVQEISIYKPSADDVLGITFEVPEVRISTRAALALLCTLQPMLARLPNFPWWRELPCCCVRTHRSRESSSLTSMLVI